MMTSADTACAEYKYACRTSGLTGSTRNPGMRWASIKYCDKTSIDSLMRKTLKCNYTRKENTRLLGNDQRYDEYVECGGTDKLRSELIIIIIIVSLVVGKLPVDWSSHRDVSAVSHLSVEQSIIHTSLKRFPKQCLSNCPLKLTVVMLEFSRISKI